MLTILSIAYPLASVGPEAVGGAEQVLSTLDRGIVAAGHRSLVVAAAGSTCAGELLATAPPRAPFDDAAVHRCHQSCRERIAHALASEAVDILHMHGVDFLHYLPAQFHGPVLATLHLWPTAYPADVFTGRFPNLHVQCVSEAQRRACPNANRAVVIRNGIDVDDYAPSDARSSYALVLGRVCPDKGVHLAIDAARGAMLDAVVAGCVFPYPTHQRYFAEEIAPRLGPHVRFVGPLAGAAKRHALASARCLLITSTVCETSSLAAMEALASGTPVVAFRTPALVELIEHGRTGFLVDSAVELVDALRQCSALSAWDCRRAALARCSSRPMIDAYLTTYNRLAHLYGATVA